MKYEIHWPNSKKVVTGKYELQVRASIKEAEMCCDGELDSIKDT